jgi:hypothetical protein
MDPLIKSKVSEKREWKCGGTVVPGVIVSMKMVREPPLRVVDSSSWNRRLSQRRSADIFLAVERMLKLKALDKGPKSSERG